MNPPYILSVEARTNIFDFFQYIVEEYGDIRAARRLQQDFLNAFEKIGNNPGIGRKRPDWTKKPYRFWTVRERYVVVYSESSPPEVLRVVSTFRDIAALLEE
jgi:plasmid stabilization system protein ParE